MKVVITGAAGFLGLRLAKKLLELGKLSNPAGKIEAIDQLVLADQVEAPIARDPRIVQVIGDVADPRVIERALNGKPESVFHLAAVVSGHAEADFDIGMRINLDAMRLLLEACRAQGKRPRFVFASSGAVFGGALPEKASESTALNPQTSYGTQKAIGELLLDDYSRKGFVDGRSLRLPTISVRPGKPNKAASSFASGIIREPLMGVPAVCPVAKDTRVWLSSPRIVIDNFIHAHELDGAALGTSRVVNLPGLTVTVTQMVNGLERIAGKQVADRVRFEYDPKIDKIVQGWPGALDDRRARRLGFKADREFDSIVRAFIDDDLNSA